ISFADDGHRGVQHVFLLSIDGFHAVDLEICVAKGTCPNLSKLTEHGIIYTNASTTKPSDSFPGLLAQVTGGTSKSTGVFYDDSYDRTLFAPGSSCKTGPGTETNLRKYRQRPALDRSRGRRQPDRAQQRGGDRSPQTAGT